MDRVLPYSVYIYPVSFKTPVSSYTFVTVELSIFYIELQVFMRVIKPRLGLKSYRANCADLHDIIVFACLIIKVSLS